MTHTELDLLQDEVLHQAYLFDDPYSYRCGVQDALAVMRQLLDDDQRAAHRPGPTHTTRAS